MTSKSRLGKGLGALFPAIPGEPNVDNVSRETFGEESNSTVKRSADGHGEMKRSGKVNTARPSANKRQSKKNTTKRGSAANALHATTVPQPDDQLGSNTIVSRETKTKSDHKRRAIPSVKAMVHPSDLFFGSSDADTLSSLHDHKNNRDDANSASLRSSTTKSTVETEKWQSNESTQPETNSGVQSVRIDEDKRNFSQRTVLDSEGSTKHDGTVNDGNGFDAPAETTHTTAQVSTPSETSDGLQDENSLKPVQGGYLVELSLDQIGPNEYQPRTIFDEEDLQELAASLKEVGVLQPVVVRKRRVNRQPSSTAEHPHKENSNSEYELIMGERRWRAAQLAGLNSIPAIVRTTSDNNMLRDALLENLHRVALNPLEEAAAYQQMMDDFGLTQEKLSRSISKSRSQIANTLRLLNLPPSVQKEVGAGVLSAGHARALLGLKSSEDMDKLAKRILQEGLSVRSTEEIVAMKTSGKRPIKRTQTRHNNPWSESPIARQLEDRFDTKVSIKGNKKRGRIEIVFSSPEDMERILGLLAPSETDKTQSQWV